jgi:glucan phosphoethanolaminetransferase (alkaline phosphatase superfamily)
MSTTEPIDESVTPTQPSAVWPPPPSIEPPPEALRIPTDFKRFNVLLLLVAYVGTLTFYQLYWMMQQIKAINSQLGYKLLSPALVWVMLVITVFNFGVAFAHVNPDTDRLVSFLANVALIVVTFMIRNGLNQALGVRPGNRAFSVKFWTFLFGPLYLQYKINIWLKAREQS